MAILESILIAVGGSLAKYLATEVLPADWQDEVATALVSVGVKQAETWLKREPDPTAQAIGKRLDTLYQRSTLDENEKNAALIEVICTLETADTAAEQLVRLDLDAALLGRELIAARPDATKQLSADGEALYEQMLRVAAEGMMVVAHRADDFLNAWARAQLSEQRQLLAGQTMILEMLHDLGPSLAALIPAPDEAATRFERDFYRPAVVETLNRMEPFGIDAPDRLVEYLHLTDSFVAPDLRIVLWQTVEGDRSDPAQRRGRGLSAPLAAMGETDPSLARPRQSDRVEQRLPAFQALAQVERLMVVGAAGSGKSTFLQWLAICAARQDFPETMAPWNRLIPFFIRLRDYQNQDFPKPEQFADRITPMGAGEMPPGWARAVLRRGDALVLVDGVDEMAREEREQMLDSLKDLVKRYPLSRYVVSSRPPVVDEMRWPAWRAWLKRARFAESWLPEMSWPQIEWFVVRWHDALAKVAENAAERDEAQRNQEGAILLLRADNALRKLAGSPLLCAMICALYQSRGQYISAERIELYESCVEMLLWERDRKHRRRKVPALADYPEFNKSQLIKLMDQLAYWMMDENASAVSAQRAVGQFERNLPRLGLSPALGPKVFEYFNERASMWDELADRQVEFRHRSFQEYLAAGWAMREDKIGALTGRALKETWRETIVLAAGRAGKAEDAWILLQQILQQADNAADEDQRRYLLLLALSCLETCNELPEGQQWDVVVDAARPVFPPHSEAEAEMAAKGGGYAIDLLRQDADAPERIKIYSIQALAAIGGTDALEAIAGYECSNDPNQDQALRRALGDAWFQFETRAYAEHVLTGAQVLSLSSLDGDCSRLADLPNLTTLDLRSTQVSDVSGLADLPNLTLLVLENEKAARLLPGLLARPRSQGLAVYTDYAGGNLYRYYPAAATAGTTTTDSR